MRVPAGVPTGGQFATSAKDEARNVHLSVVQGRFDATVDVEPEVPLTPHPTDAWDLRSGDPDYQWPVTPPTDDYAIELYPCPACKAPANATSCAYCDGSGQVDPDAAASYQGPRSSFVPAPSPTRRRPAYSDTHEPDFEAIMEGRAESAYEARGAEREWAGAEQ